MIKAPPSVYEMPACEICGLFVGNTVDVTFGHICRHCSPLMQQLGMFKTDDDGVSRYYYDFANMRPGYMEHFKNILTFTHNTIIITLFADMLLDYYGVTCDHDAMIPVIQIKRRRVVQHAP